MKITKKQLMELYDELYAIYGPQYWWPANSPWEVCVGAILTQNTNWNNVEKAITNLKNANLLPNQGEGEGRSPGVLECESYGVGETEFCNVDYPTRLFTSNSDDIAQLIRPSGYFNMKSKRLVSMAEWWLKNGNIEYKNEDISELRTSLLQINGVGPETADTIILYAFNLPVFVIDTYTKRVCNAYINTPDNIDYNELQEIFMNNLPHKTQLFNEFHALIVRISKEKEWKQILSGKFC